MAYAPPISHLHVVLRGSGFDADGLHRERGEVVDTTAWRSVRPLVDTRHLAAAPREDVDTFETCPCGRYWIDADAAGAHTCPARTTTRTKVAK